VSFAMFVGRVFFRMRSSDFIETAALLKGLTSLAFVEVDLK
jgi:hypothetical protein